MILKVFCVFDSAAGFYQRPFTMRSRGEAQRGFVECANDEKHAYFQSPGDYTLFEIAEWDDSTGILRPAAAGFVKLCSALEVKVTSV